MKKITINNIELEGTYFDYLYIFLDDSSNIILLPFLWLVHICSTKSHYIWRIKSVSDSLFNHNENIERQLDLVSLSDNSIKNYVGHLFHFLDHVNNDKSSVDNIEKVSDKYINTYLNTHLSKRIRSVSALSTHKAAIESFLNFLNYLKIRTPPVIRVYPKTTKLIAKLDDRPLKISYVSRENRSYLLRECTSKRDQLILRMGYEVGLRTSECCGLVLKDIKLKSSVKKGLVSLFQSLAEEPNRLNFSYHLLGKYTKGGRTRIIYFDRELLISMKDYHDTERLYLETISPKKCETLFLRRDYGGIGRQIGTKHASNVFTKLKKSIKHLNQSLSYHDLRHTFATELYHNELKTKNGRETRSESAALLVVAQRLGHKDANHSTSLYIRLRQQLLALENA